MKDLFCLVNTFMNRTKNEADADDPHEDEVLTLPLEAEEDSRVLPGSSRRPGGGAGSGGVMIAALEPFLPMLPADLRSMDLKRQKLLHKSLYSAGVSAALSLHKFIYESPATTDNATKDPPSSLFEMDREGADWKEIFTHLGKFVALDDAAKTIRKMSFNVDELVRNDAGGQALVKLISNEVSAAALAAFASATFRRPPTKHAESLMCASEESDPSSATTAAAAAAAAAGMCPNHQQHEAAITPHSDFLMDLPPPPPSRGAACPHMPLPLPQPFPTPTAVGECGCGGEHGGDSSDTTNNNNGDELEVMEDEDCLFRYVCSAGYEDLAKLLVSMRQSTEFSQKSDSSPLMEAACAGHAGVVELLIRQGANVNQLSATQNTALIYASASGHLDCVRALLKSNKCDLTIRNENGRDALMEASNVGALEIVKALVESGATPLSVMDNLDFKESALTLSAYRGHVAVVEYLISVMPENGDDRAEEFHTALLEASMDGHLEVARVLLNSGAPVNLPSDSFESPLTLAACGGHQKLVSLLIDFGANLEEPNDEGYSPLMEACREGHREVAELLLERGANVNAKIDEGLETSLTLAASGGFLPVVELLVSKGGDLTVGERPPLYEAAQEGHLEVVQFIAAHLRQAGLPQDALLKQLNEALLCAAEINNVEICACLLDNGAELDYVSKEGRTVLMNAAQQNSLLVVEMLLKGGAQVNVLSEGNECTALSLAALYGNSEVLKYLLEHGANPHIILKDSSNALLEASRGGHTACVEILLDHKYIGVPTLASKQRPSGAAAAAVADKKASKTVEGVSCGSSTCPLAHSKSVGSVPTVKLTRPTKSKGHATPNKSNDTRASSLSATSSEVESDQQQQQPPAMVEVSNESSEQPPSVSPSPTTTADPAALLLDAQSTPNSSQLFRALATAAANSPYNGPDDWLFAQFIQRSLITTKKREAMSEEELRAFTEMIHNQFRAIFPSGQVDPSALVSTAGQQALSNIYAAAALAEAGHEDIPAALLLEGAANVNAALGLPPAVVVEPVAVAVEEAPAPMVVEESVEPKQEIFGSPESPSPPTVACCPHTATKTATPVKPTPTPGPTPSGPKRKISIGSSAATTLPQPPQETAPPQPRGRRAAGHKCCNAPPPPSLTNAPPAHNNNNSRMIPDHQYPHNHHHNQQQYNSSAFVDMETESNHDTALSLAAMGGHTALVSLLISRGADLDHRDKKGFTPLILAASAGHLETCRALIEAGAQIDAQADRTKDTALSLACSGGRKDVVELFLNNGANKEHRNSSDYTPLSLAASGGFDDIIRLLLNAGAEINSRTGSKLGIAPLMLSAMNGHESTTLLLLENGSDINAQIETNRNTALTLSCFQGRTEVVRLLLQYGALVDHRAKTGLTPLMESANGGFVEVGKLLLQFNADVNASPVPTSRDTALTIAADKGHHQFVDLLIHAGAQINVRNKKGASALWLASNGGHLETVTTLVKHNADTDAQDNRKVSPLMAAYRKGHAKVVKYLVRHVNQFPSDTECTRYISTLADQDLINKCRQCVDYIMAAKAKQAEEANKAAESLLSLLAAEEALAESKKRTKQRQKEKKKAKKAAAAKKQQVEEEVEVEEPIVEEEPEEPVVEEPEPDPEAEPIVSSSASDLRVPLMESNTPAITSLKDVKVAQPPNNNGSTTSATATAAATNHNKNGRRQPRRDRNRNINEEGGNGRSTTSMTTNTATANGKASTATLNSEEAEWLRASKKVSKPKGPQQQQAHHPPPPPPQPLIPSLAQAGKASASTTHTQHQQQVTDPAFFTPMETWSNADAPFNSGAGGGATTTAPNSSKDPKDARRRSTHLLNVNASAIARVIGRAGSNINAIREATGAHIEVEKMAARREQSTRQIAIKGGAEAIRMACWMIDQLISDHDIHISEIIEQADVQAEHPPKPAEGVVQRVERVVTPPAPPVVKAAPEVVSTKVNEVVPPTTTAPAPPPLPMQDSTTTTNVWQQRAAIREMQKAPAPPPPFMPNGRLTLALEPSDLGPSPSLIPPPPPTATTSIGENQQQHSSDTDEALLLEAAAQLSKEELQRKAPGYQRPTSSHAQQQQQQHSPRSAGSLTESIDDGSKQGSVEGGKTTARTPRPLSEIWESDPLSPPTLMASLASSAGGAGSLIFNTQDTLWLTNGGGGGEGVGEEPSLFSAFATSAAMAIAGGKMADERQLMMGSGWGALFGAGKEWGDLPTTTTTGSSSNWSGGTGMNGACSSEYERTIGGGVKAPQPNDAPSFTPLTQQQQQPGHYNGSAATTNNRVPPQSSDGNSIGGIPINQPQQQFNGFPTREGSNGPAAVPALPPISSSNAPMMKSYMEIMQAGSVGAGAAVRREYPMGGVTTQQGQFGPVGALPAATAFGARPMLQPQLQPQQCHHPDQQAAAFYRPPPPPPPPPSMPKAAQPSQAQQQQQMLFHLQHQQQQQQHMGPGPIAPPQARRFAQPPPGFASNGGVGVVPTSSVAPTNIQQQQHLYFNSNIPPPIGGAGANAPTPTVGGHHFPPQQGMQPQPYFGGWGQPSIGTGGRLPQMPPQQQQQKGAHIPQLQQQQMKGIDASAVVGTHLMGMHHPMQQQQQQQQEQFQQQHQSNANWNNASWGM